MQTPSSLDVNKMIADYVKTLGYSPEQAYNAQEKVWHWLQNSYELQVYIETIYFKNGLMREYLRIFAPLLELPPDLEVDTTTMLRFLLELNDTKLGVKISLMPKTSWVYATYERDIKGMDYQELATCLNDLAWWAERLSQEITAKIAELS